MGCALAISSFLFPNQQADDQTDDGWNDPAEIDGEEGQVLACQSNDSLQVQAFLQGCGQGLQQIKQSRGAGESGDADVHALAVTEELAGEGQQDQCNGGGIQEHQHRQGIVQDLAQAEVGYHEGKQGEDNCPDFVGQGLGEHPDKSLGAAGDQAD